MSDELIDIRLRLTGGTEAAAEVKRVSGEIKGLDDSTTRATVTTSKATASSSKFQSTLSSLGRTMAYGSIPVFGALAYEVTKSVNAYRESRKVGLETQAVIKSTGAAAGVTADEVGRLASTLALKTGVDDETIQSGANMLLTFKNIRDEVGKGNDVFDQAVATVNDLAAKMGGDMKGAAIQVGKALNDPIAGISALSRVGVTFDEQTKDQIATLVKQGNTLKAQKIILRELNSEFGGTAKSQHDAVDRLGQAWGELEESLGKVLYPALKDVTQWLTKTIRQTEHGRGPLVDFAHAVGSVGDTLSDIVAPFDFAIDRLKNLADGIVFINKPLIETIKLFGKIDDLFAGDIGQVNQLDIAGATAPITAAGPPAPSSGGGPHRRGGGKLPKLVPVAPTGTGTTTPRDMTIRVPVYLDGQKIAQNVVKHALEANARR